MKKRSDSLPGIEENEFVPRIVSSPGSEQPPDDYDPDNFLYSDDDDDDDPVVPPPPPPRPAAVRAITRPAGRRGAECERDLLAYTDPDAYLMGLMNRQATPCNGLFRGVCRAHTPEWSAHGVKCEDVPHCEWRGRCVEKPPFDGERLREVREDYRERLLFEARARGY